MKTQFLLNAFLFTALSINAQFPYKDASLSASQRAEDLCGRLTLNEKADIMCNTSPAIPRLGIPQFEWWSEGLHGVGRNGFSTVFPATIGMAASFDDVLLNKIFTAVSDEARAKNTEARHNGTIKKYQGLSFWTPNINIFRDPRWGRGQETYGEDPYLTTRMGLAVVSGLQGPDNHKYRKLLACAKHFAVHSGPEWNRHSFNIENLSPRDLWETYLPAFKALVQKGKVAEVMCAYQSIDGEPCCGNNKYLQQILRNEWNFKGLVTSDCGAVSDFWEKGHHEVSPDAKSASSKAVLSGTDVECGKDYKTLPEAVKSGLITEKQIDISLTRLLKARFELGDFDPDSLNDWTKIPSSVIACKAHKQLALDMAREVMVLLQNKKNILPLDKNDEIVVMGPNATDSTMMWGNYCGHPTKTITILDGIKSKAKLVRYIAGCGFTDNDSTSIQKLLSQVGTDKIVVFVGGISPKLEGEEMKVNKPGFKGGDRTSIELPDAQRDIIAALHKKGKSVILVNCSGSAIGLVPETNNADAILQAWYPGEQGGTAVADVLFGDYNPSGKLPVTFYKNVGQLPDYENYDMAGRTYRYFKGKPLFPFGFGLSYTKYTVSTPVYNNNAISVNVSNVGDVEGDEIIQVYIKNLSDKNGPIKTLKNFTRVHLKVKESKTVNINMPLDCFDMWNTETNTMGTVHGKYKIMVGTSSRDSDLKTVDVTI